MKLEVGKKYLTREGKVVRIICVDRKGPQNKYSVIALEINKENGAEYFPANPWYTLDGRFNMQRESKYDIVSEYKEPAKKDMWLLFYYYYEGYNVIGFNNKNEMCNLITSYQNEPRFKALGIKKVTLTEGEFYNENE